MTPTFKALTPAGEWVEGWLMRHKRFLDEKPYIKSSNIGEIVWYEVLPETVCMSTGRADSTGKMMFNGDFVQVDEWMEARQNHSIIYRIEYDNVNCTFYLIDDNGFYPLNQFK